MNTRDPGDQDKRDSVLHCASKAETSGTEIPLQHTTTLTAVDGTGSHTPAIQTGPYQPSNMKDTSAQIVQCPKSTSLNEPTVKSYAEAQPDRVKQCQLTMIYRQIDRVRRYSDEMLMEQFQRASIIKLPEQLVQELQDQIDAGCFGSPPIGSFHTTKEESIGVVASAAAAAAAAAAAHSEYDDYKNNDNDDNNAEMQEISNPTKLQPQSPQEAEAEGEAEANPNKEKIKTLPTTTTTTNNKTETSNTIKSPKSKRKIGFVVDPRPLTSQPALKLRGRKTVRSIGSGRDKGRGRSIGKGRDRGSDRDRGKGRGQKRGRREDPGQNLTSEKLELDDDVAVFLG